MKAAQIDRYGEPDVLKINEVDRPAPGEGEVLVLVEASMVSRVAEEKLPRLDRSTTTVRGSPLPLLSVDA